MKTYYICEECNRRYENPKDALDCEAKHKKERVEREKLEKEKEKRRQEIKELTRKYTEDYGEVPLLHSTRFPWIFV